MKLTVELIFIALFFSACTTQGQKTEKPVPTDGGVVIVYKFINCHPDAGKWGKLNTYGLQYIDSSYRRNNITLKYASNRDTSFVKTISVNGPTECSFIVGKINTGKKVEMVSYAYLCMPGDSLKFIVDNTVLRFDSTSTCFNMATLYGGTAPAWWQGLKTIYSKNNIEKVYDSVAVSFLNRNRVVDSMYSTERINESTKKSLLAINKIDYYHAILNGATEKLKKEEINSSIIGKEYKKVINEAFWNNPVYYMSLRSLLYDITAIAAKLEGNYSVSGTANLHYLPSLFHRKKITDGYIYDLLLADSATQTTAARTKIIEKFKPILFNYNSFIERNSFSAKAVPDSVNVVVTDLKGKKSTLKDILKNGGKFTLIDLWASWCNPCIAQIPKLKKAATQFSKLVNFISISADEDAKKWFQAAKKYGVLTNSYRFEKYDTNPFLKFIELTTIPRFLLVNPKGEIMEMDFVKPSDPQFNVLLTEIIQGYK